MDPVRKVRLAGLLSVAGMFAGVFSVAPAIDSATYLTEAAAHTDDVIVAAIFQFAMSLSYAGVAALLYPVVRRFGNSLSIGYFSSRIIAATLSIVGTILLLSLLVLSREFVHRPSQDILATEALGNVLKASRDHVNHVFMVFVLCTGNFLLYVLLLRSRLIPRWLSVWGMAGAALSVTASTLVLFGSVDIITPRYLALNTPTAIHELVLGVWMIVKGFDKRVMTQRTSGG